MKKSKKILIMIISIVVVLIILSIIISVKNEKLALKEDANIIKDNYESLSTIANTYNQIRTEYTNLSSTFYYDTYSDELEEYTELLTKYNETVMELDTFIDNISQRCNVIYRDSEVNTICNNYKALYEKMINLYVSDLTSYNQKIEEYNQYKLDNVESFPMIYTEYIDYNNDSKYEGIDNHEED